MNDNENREEGEDEREEMPQVSSDMMIAVPLEFEEPDLDMLEAAAEWADLLSKPHELADRSEFDDWLGRKPAHEYAFAEMLALRDAVTPVAIDAARRDRHWRPIRHHRRWAGMLIASLVIGVMGLSWGPEIVLRLRADAVTARGETDRLRLADGSRVMLNSQSAIELHVSRRGREVRLLKGEAFFDIARDPAHPFTVMAGDARVRVLGTHFNVRMDGLRTTVTVEEGRVAFGAVSAGSEGQVILTDGQQAFAEGDATQRQPVYDPAAALAWRGGQMIFYRARLRDVVAEIDRYRSAPVFLLGAGLGARTVSGAFSTKTPDIALTNVVKTLGAQMTTLPGGIIVVHD